MMLEAIPRNPGTVIEMYFAGFAEEVDKSTSQQDVFQGRFAISAGADQVDRACGLTQHLANGAVVDEGADQHSLGLGSTQDGTGAVAGRQDDGGAAATLGSVLGRRVSQVESVDRLAAALASKQHFSGRQAIGKRCASSISRQGRTARQPAASACTIVVEARSTSMATAMPP